MSNKTIEYPIKKKLLELVAETSAKFEGQPNILFNGAYEDADVSFIYYVKTDEEGKVMCEFEPISLKEE